MEFVNQRGADAMLITSDTLHYLPPNPEPEVDILPDVFPTEREVYRMLLDAVRVCVGENMLRPVNEVMEPVLGDSANLFNDSIVYKEIGMNGSLDLFQGHIPVLQFVGKILHDDEVIKAYLGTTRNPLVNHASMGNTRVRYQADEGGRVRVEHRMPYDALAERYLDCTDATISRSGEHMMTVTWAIHTQGNDMSGLQYAAANLGTVLNIYFKLLTRFPSCQSHQNDLPSFRTS